MKDFHLPLRSRSVFFQELGWSPSSANFNRDQILSLQLFEGVTEPLWPDDTPSPGGARNKYHFKLSNSEAAKRALISPFLSQI